MNWGHGLTLSFIGFAGFIIFMAVKSFDQNIDLVTEDYYREELNYQQRIDQIQQTKAQGMEAEVELSDGLLVLTFPSAPDKGEAHLYRPSDSQFDQRFQLSQAATMAFDRTDFLKGYYILKISWEAEGQAYYQEKGIVL